MGWLGCWPIPPEWFDEELLCTMKYLVVETTLSKP